jgi:hypothetical protein
MAAVSIDLWPRPALAATRRKWRTEIAHVLETLAQRRDAQRHHVEPVVEVLAEQALLDLRLELAVGGGE